MDHHGRVACEGAEIDDKRRIVLDQLAGYAQSIGRVRPATLAVRAERTSPGRRLCSVTFQTDAGTIGSFFVGVAVDERGGLSPGGSAGGTGRAPARQRLWVNLAGWWGGGDCGGAAQLWAGGEVLGPGADRVHDVLLRFPDGSELHDTPTAGVVLFLGEDVGQLDEAEVVIRDGDGKTLATHPAL
jgi:hypothetical protein